MRNFILGVTIMLSLSCCKNPPSQETEGTGSDSTAQGAIQKSVERKPEKKQRHENVRSASDFRFAFVKEHDVALRESADVLSNVTDSLDYLDGLEIMNFLETNSSTWFEVKGDNSDLAGWVSSGDVSLFLEKPESIEYYLDLFGGGFEKIEDKYSIEYVKEEGPASYRVYFELETGLIVVKHAVMGELEMKFDGEVTYRMSGKSIDFLFKEYSGYTYGYPSGNFLVLNFHAHVGDSWVKVFDIGKKESMNESVGYLGNLLVPEFEAPESFSLELSREQSRNGAEIDVEERDGQIYATIEYPKDKSRPKNTYILKDGAFMLNN